MNGMLKGQIVGYTAPPVGTGIPTPPAVNILATTVESHNNVSSCWTVVDNTVLGMTRYIAVHPGGKEGA